MNVELSQDDVQNIINAYDKDIKKMEQQEKEIDRLNNIINELEKWLNKYFVGTMSDAVLNKLKELKENK